VAMKEREDQEEKNIKRNKIVINCVAIIKKYAMNILVREATSLLYILLYYQEIEDVIKREKTPRVVYLSFSNQTNSYYPNSILLFRDVKKDNSNSNLETQNHRGLFSVKNVFNAFLNTCRHFK
jgi:hypothetical protein